MFHYLKLILPAFVTFSLLFVDRFLYCPSHPEFDTFKMNFIKISIGLAMNVSMIFICDKCCPAGGDKDKPNDQELNANLLTTDC